MYCMKDEDGKYFSRCDSADESSCEMMTTTTAWRVTSVDLAATTSTTVPAVPTPPENALLSAPDSTTSTRSTTQKTLSTSAAFSATSSQTAWLSKFWMVVTTSTSPARTTSEVIQLSPSATSRLPTLNPRTLNGWAVIQ